MKKIFFKSTSLFLLAALLITGCQKQIQEKENTIIEEENSSAARNDDDKPGCQLTHYDDGSGYSLDIKYSKKGLASELSQTYSDGYHETHQIFYDKKERFIKTRITSTDYPVIKYDFIYTGDVITRAKGYLEGTNEPFADIFYTYNRKGQLIRTDDVIRDYHLKYTYNTKGFVGHTDYYLGTDLFVTYDYTYRIPNKNPYLAIPGVDYGFWGGFDFDKWWETSDYIVLYDEGTPYVLADYDQARTVLNKGPHDYLNSAVYYDRVSESNITLTFNYQNCGRGSHDDNAASSVLNRQNQPLSPANKLRRVLTAPGKEIKAKMKELIREYRK
jgi:hypothetical protein